MRRSTVRLTSRWRRLPKSCVSVAKSGVRVRLSVYVSSVHVKTRPTNGKTPSKLRCGMYQHNTLHTRTHEHTHKHRKTHEHTHKLTKHTQTKTKPTPHLEHSGTTREDNVLVERATDIDGRALDARVNNLGQRREEVRREDLGVEEQLGAEEPLVADVHGVRLYDGCGCVGMCAVVCRCGWCGCIVRRWRWVYVLWCMSVMGVAWQ